MSAIGYLAALTRLLTEADGGQLTEMAERMAAVLAAGKVIHTFGCGHSALVAAEPVYRAKTPAAVNFLGLSAGGGGLVGATAVEGQPERASALVRNGGVEPDDLVIVVSHSGRGALGIAVAREARRAGAGVLAITHTAGCALAREADLCLTTGVPNGDALLDGERLGPASSIVSAALLDAAIAEAVLQLHRSGEPVPLLQSVHADAGPAHNHPLLDVLAPRIPSWHATPSV